MFVLDKCLIYQCVQKNSLHNLCTSEQTLGDLSWYQQPLLINNHCLIGKTYLQMHGVDVVDDVLRMLSPKDLLYKGARAEPCKTTCYTSRNMRQMVHNRFKVHNYKRVRVKG